MGAPNVVRGLSHSGNVSARELAADGLVHGLASDYVPMSLIQACFVFHEVLGIELPDAVAMVTAEPAAMAGLSGSRPDRHRRPGRPGRGQGPRQLPMVRGVWREGHRVV